jgi:hypothetical protein
MSDLQVNVLKEFMENELFTAIMTNIEKPESYKEEVKYARDSLYTVIRSILE